MAKICLQHNILLQAAFDVPNAALSIAGGSQMAVFHGDAPNTFKIALPAIPITTARSASTTASSE